MRPAISEGSLVLVQKGISDLKRSDIITFINPNNAGQFITHRIHKIASNSGKIAIQTKGDANKIPDKWVIKKEMIWGKVMIIIPFLGYLINFAKTKIGV